jgi:hypothetical protein
LGANGAVLARRHRAEATRYALEIGDAVEVAIASGAGTTGEIAERLNAAGVPSRQGARWHPASVARVLRRLRSAHDHDNLATIAPVSLP